MANLINDILENYANKIIDALIKNLQDKGRYGAGTFAQSIIALPIKVMGGKYIMQIEMDDFWVFIDEGVEGYGAAGKNGSPYKYKKNGKPIPLSAMKKHIANRGLTPRAKKSLKVKGKGKLSKKIKKGLVENEIDSFAWAIGAKIKRDGLKPTNFATEVFEGELIKEMQKELLKTIGKEIVIEIKKDLK